MAGQTTTEKGLGDGVESFFKTFIDLANEDVAEKDQISFPDSARNVLNAFFSAKAQSSFDQTGGCSSNKQATFLADSDPHIAITDAPAPPELVAMIEKLPSDRRRAALEAIGLEQYSVVGENVEQSPLVGSGSTVDIVAIADDASFATAVGDPCFAHTGTSAFVSKGSDGGTASFELAVAAAKVRFNVDYDAVATIVGVQPVIERFPIPGTTARGRRFTGEVKGAQELTKGGGCAPPWCADEWVKGTCLITGIVTISAAVRANVPAKLKDVLPALGGAAGLSLTLRYNFDFIHYPRTAPTGGGE